MLRCPICGASEVGPNGKLLVRGYKVTRKDMFWSQCISGLDHGTTLVNYDDGRTEDVPIPKEPWFAFNEDDPTEFFIEIQLPNGKHVDAACYGEEA